MADVRHRAAAGIRAPRPRRGLARGDEPGVPHYDQAPMSDVPAAAFWALATWKVLDESRFSAALAGLATAMAILIRPNLVPLAAVLGAWLLWRRHKAPRGDRIRAASAFAAGVVPGCLAIAWINQGLFGSPLASGYGSTADFFSIAEPVDERHQVRRVADGNAEPPLVFAGMLALVVPSTHLWPTVEMRGATVLLAALTIAVCAIYAPYIPFDAWWFLRFLLPCWPALCIGTVAVLRSASQFAGSRAASRRSHRDCRARALHGLHPRVVFECFLTTKASAATPPSRNW